MSIKSQGGVFGRNPTFNDVTVDGDLIVDGTLTIGGNVITGLDYEGGWNASTNTPDLTTTPPAAGKFWIVSVAGSTDLGGITNWTVGDWALYDGSAWQRVEGGTVDLTNGVTGILPIANGGTNASTASTARSNLGSGAVGDNLFTATTALAAQQAMDTEVGTDVQAYDAGLQSISGLTTAADKMIYTTASDTYAVTDLTAAGRALLDDADAAAQRTTLGLGTAATTASTDYATAAQGSTADSALQPGDVDDTPVDGATTAPVSSNWAYDHAALTTAHGISSFGATLVDDADAATARTTLGLGSAATTASTDYATAAQGSTADSALQPADIGVSVQGYDANILTSSDIGSTVQGYDAGTLTSADIGSTVQGYDADTTKNDVSNTFTQDQVFSEKIGINEATSPSTLLEIKETLASTTSNKKFIELSADYASGVGDGFGSYIGWNARTTGNLYREVAKIGTHNYTGDNAAHLSFWVRSNASSYDEKVRFKTNGDVVINSGNLVIGTAGKGIDFSATSGTGTSELLDDYEEGTWTPDDQSGASLVFSDVYGYYTKIGDVVTAFGRVTFPSTASGATIIIGGLPFVVASTNQAGGGFIRLTSSGRNDTVVASAGASTFLFYANNLTPPVNSDYSTDRVDFVLIYKV